MINLNSLFEKFDNKIKQLPDLMEKMSGDQPENPFDISPADLSEVFINLIGMADQIDTFWRDRGTLCSTYGNEKGL